MFPHRRGCPASKTLVPIVRTLALAPVVGARTTLTIVSASTTAALKAATTVVAATASSTASSAPETASSLWGTVPSTPSVSSPHGKGVGAPQCTLVDILVPHVWPMGLVLVEQSPCLGVEAPTKGVEMTASPVMAGVLVPDDQASGSVVPSNAIVGVAVAMKAAAAGRARVAVVAPASAAPFAVTARLLVAALILFFILLVLPLILGFVDLLILEMGVPISLEVVANVARIHRVSGVERIHFLVIRQPVLHGAGERVPNGL